MRVPLPRAEIIFIFPPRFPMRSRIPAMPKVCRAGFGLRIMPTPSSSMVRRTESPSRAHFDDHPAGVGVLGDVMQSFLHHAINRCLQAPGRRPKSRGQLTRAFTPVLLARSLASLRTAAIKPSSCSTSGDRRPMMRRIPSMVAVHHLQGLANLGPRSACCYRYPQACRDTGESPSAPARFRRAARG